MRLTSRVDINVGYSCNERCKFCYYIRTVKDRARPKDLTTDEVKRQLAYIRRRGIEVLDITGGEPTIRRDLLTIAAYARRLGFRSVSLITNGIRLAQPDYARACVEAGIDDFLFSLHGHEAAPHDRVTEVPGSFAKAVRGVDNLRRYPVKLRANCVISGFNHVHAVAVAARFHELGIGTANFILFNPIVEADWRSEPALNVAYRDAAPYLQAAIDAYAGRFDKLTVRYIPWCLMRGYEGFVTNMPQIQYDADEWDYLVRTTLREGRLVTAAALGLGILAHPTKRRALAGGWRVFSRESVKYFLQLKNKVRGPACRSCSYRLVCDGLWRRYAEWRGFDELRAVPGPLLTDPTHFMRARAARRPDAAPRAPEA